MRAWTWWLSCVGFGAAAVVVPVVYLVLRLVALLAR